MDVSSPLHIAMFPWFAMGHFTPYLHLSNKFAIRVPHVNGLPHDAETTSDVPFSLFSLIATAMDHTEKQVELLLRDLEPKIVFFDFQYWLPNLTKKLGIKSLQYLIWNPISSAYLGNIPRKSQGKELTEFDLMKPPAGFPDSFIKFHSHELRFLASIRKLEFGSGVLLLDRVDIGTRLSDAVAFKGCREIDGLYADYLQTVFGKPVLLSGPLLPEPPKTTLDEKWVSWLKGFKQGSVVFCAYGSEALKPPIGFDSIEDALPEGFNERVKGKGIVYGSWIQQQLILEHPSVGCFITHCGAASITEGLVNTCQLVLLPRIGSDHIMNARMMSRKLKVGVEVEKGEEDGLFTKESVCKAVKTVMDDENEVGREVRANHDKMRNFLLSSNLESSCVDSFCQKLYDLLWCFQLQ
ncbi:anthocyanidin 3-O-glucoside 2'''-O-xylosyltransferase [Trifolium repens]|nr:anthocyanidin 3-O-glucoside 2'''-O-xylosyltransferase [Trifolium repens]